jgi:hypothetical protein
MTYDVETITIEMAFIFWPYEHVGSHVMMPNNVMIAQNIGRKLISICYHASYQTYDRTPYRAYDQLAYD